MSKRDYYEVLGVEKNVENADLKKAYRRMAMKFHPDRNPDAKDAEDKFKEVKEAYEVLSDSQKRNAYNQFGHAGVNGSHSSGAGFEGGFGDIFGDVFGDIFGGGRSGGSQVYRGADLAYQVELSLEESAFGIEKEIKINKQIGCPKCEGSGANQGYTPETCEQCGGAGQVRMQQGFFSVQQACPTCHGKGKQIKDPCTKCHGQGLIKEGKTLSVKIPPGVDNGDRIRLQGEGEVGENNGPAGDLYVQVAVKEHPIFQRDGMNLYCEVPVSFATATLGGEIEIPSLEGRLKFKIPNETQTNKTFKMGGKGVKSARRGGIGDLYCVVNVETPVNLSNKQKELLREFDKSMHKKRDRHSPKNSSWLDRVKTFVDDLTG